METNMHEAPPTAHIAILDSDNESDILPEAAQHTSLFGVPTAQPNQAMEPVLPSIEQPQTPRRSARSSSIAFVDYTERPSRTMRHCAKYSKTERTCTHRHRSDSSSGTSSSYSSKSRTGTSSSKSSQSPSLNPYKSFSQLATVLIGPSEIPFQMHTSILERGSSFFAAAFNGAFIEGQAKVLRLPDIEAKYFEHVALWLYSSRLEDAAFFYKDGKPTYFTLLDLYALADRLCIDGMRNGLIERVAELAEATNSVPTPSDTHILYESIRDTAPLRLLVLDLFAYKKTDNLIATHPDDWHPSFLRDLICRLKKPGPTSITRHDVRAWKPLSWQTTRACEGCKGVLRPNVVAMLCASCQKGFCLGCVEKGEGGGCEWGIAERECKPWLRGTCERYHEHESEDARTKCTIGR